MKNGIEGLCVLAEHNGCVYQVALTKSDEEAVKSFITNLFVASGRNFELIGKPLTEVRLEVNNGKS